MSPTNWGELVDLGTGEVLSSRELGSRVEKRSGELRRAGLGPGNRHFITNHNCAETFIEILATWEVDACAVAIDGTDPRMSELQNALAKVEPWKNDIALALITSGSTGEPKITLHSRIQIEKKWGHLAQAVPERDRAVTLCALPTHFGHGLVCNSLFPLLNGSRLLIAKSFSLELCARIDELIAKHGITFFSTTPPIWNLIGAFARPQAKKSLRRIHCASAPLDGHRIELMRQWAGEASIWNVFGMTEFLGWVSGQVMTESTDAGFVGNGWGVELRVDSSAAEIQIKGDSLLAGWAPISRPQNVTWSSPGDWWSTKDTGTFDTRGLKIGGRLDFVINKGGLKVQPEEVESAALSSAMVKGCACLGKEDALWGQKVLLFVEPYDVAKFSAVQLRDWLIARLAHYKVPDTIQVIPSLPVNSRGKLDREKLRSWI